MQTRIATFAAKLIESSWLAALAVLPIFFNRYSQRIFEEDKALLLRSMALVMCAALIVWSVEQGRHACALAARRVWGTPLVRPALLLTAAYCVSTIFSVAPQVSFWGAYIRCQGTYTWLSYMTVFLAIILLVRRREEVERMVTVALVASVPVVVYACIQHLDIDPIPWAGDVAQRPSSMAGNPIFLSAFMIMVVPLTLVRVIEQCARLLERPVANARRLPRVLLTGAYLLLLILQLLTVIYSQSRGPFIGLGLALLLFFLILAVHYRMRWLVVTMTGAAAAGLLFVLILNLPNSPLEPLRDVKYLGHLGDVFNVEAGTGKVRVLIWEGATALLAADPVRDIVGYGPEAMYLVYSRFYPAELGDYESRGALPDRAHNETFDALITLGVVGFVAQMIVFLSFFYYVLRRLGMIRTATERNAFVAVTVAGGALGGIVPYLIEGRFRLAGVGFPVGIACALMVFLIALAFRERVATDSPPRSDSLLLLALFSAVVAHFVEIHFGIALVVTRLYFWVYLALAVAVGTALVGSEDAEARAADGFASTADASAAVPAVTGSLLSLSPVVGLILAVLSFGFYMPVFGDAFAAGMPLCILLSGWLFGALVIAAEAAAETHAHGRAQTRLSAYATTSLGVWLLFLAVHVAWTGWQPVGERASVEVAQALGAHLANTVSVFYAFVLVALLATATIAYLRDEPLLASRASAWGWRAIIYPLLLLGAVAVAVVTNLGSVRADGIAKLATLYQHRKEWEPARALYAEASRRAPSVERYAFDIARMLMEAARASSDAAQREAYFNDALAVIQSSRQRDPLNTDQVRNLARLYRMWAGLTADPATQARRYDEAGALYRQAMIFSPNHAGIMNEWATYYLERNDPAKAFTKFEESLKIDDRYATTYWLRANAQFDAGRLEDALADYDRALAIQPQMMAGWSGKALVLARMNRLPEAIAASGQALSLRPDDVICRRNLALLYKQTGRYDLAIAEAQTALGVAKEEEDRRTLEAFIEQLNEEWAVKSSADDGS